MAEIPKWRQRVATYYARALPYAGWLVFFGWLGGCLQAVSTLCPADTLASGTISGSYWWLVGSSLVASWVFHSFDPNGWFLPVPKRPRLADVVRAERRRDLAVAGCLLVIALLLAVTGLSFSFCARPQGIFVHATPFDKGRSYAWTDVRKITAYCSGGRRFGSVLLDFDLEMNDGKTIQLGRSYRAVSDALRDVPFIYDDSGMSKCEPSLRRRLLATRPGVHVNEPH